MKLKIKIFCKLELHIETEKRIYYEQFPRYDMHRYVKCFGCGKILEHNVYRLTGRLDV